MLTVGPRATCRHHTNVHILIVWKRLERRSAGSVWEGLSPWNGCRGGSDTLTDALCPLVLFSTATRTSSQVTFPIDFFEHNQQLTDVEFGGNDLLQVYNAQQIKHRLNSTGMYVANTKVRTVLGWVPCLRRRTPKLLLECKLEIYTYCFKPWILVKWSLE